MVYIWEFEFVESDGYALAIPCGDIGEGTFGENLEDAVESAADWLGGLVEDTLLGYRDLPPMKFGHEPEQGGHIIAIAVERELKDVSAMTATEAASILDISVARVSQLAKAGLLRAWKDGNRLMVASESVYARKAGEVKPGRPKTTQLA